MFERPVCDWASLEFPGRLVDTNRPADRNMSDSDVNLVVGASDGVLARVGRLHNPRAEIRGRTAAPSMPELAAMSRWITGGGATIRSWSGSGSSSKTHLLRVVNENEPIISEVNQ